MTELSSLELGLCQQLLNQPVWHANDYTELARAHLLEVLFTHLCNNDGAVLQSLFRGKVPAVPEPWLLSQAQGAQDGAEYTEAARGKPCGHILKAGEPSYRCKTCTTDDTCVLCSRCYEASDHEGHQIQITVSAGNAGCCDCGDPEAWRLPVRCGIHSTRPDSQSDAERPAPVKIPQELKDSIRSTVSRALNFFVDVLSCSPEQFKAAKTIDSVLEDEKNSRLTSPYCGPDQEEDAAEEFCLVLWNDEKHNPYDARDAIARAVRIRRTHALDLATVCDRVGRVVIKKSTRPAELLESAHTIEKTKFTTTIRSSRDTYREQMCATIMEWLADIAGCDFLGDNSILRYIICEEMLSSWSKGSGAHRKHIGGEPLFDYEDYLWGPSKQDNGFLTPSAWHAIELRAAAVRQAGQAQLGEELEVAEVIGDGNANEAQDDRDNEVDMSNEMDLDAVTDIEESLEHDMDDALEQSEATLAGYPPPPLPPAPRPGHMTLPGHSAIDARQEADPPYQIPSTTQSHGGGKTTLAVLSHWLEAPDAFHAHDDILPCLDLWRRVRIDWMILYDMRLWNHVRCVMRDLFIGTVVNVAEFKSILGLRFAGLYAPLAQLYLIADREPDCSVISLSLQMLTTPSITDEIIDRGNFLTNLMAIIYTFITTRQVGHPREVNLSATLALESGVAANRRLDHFFNDLRYLLESPLALEHVRDNEQYLLQFLDLAKLHQGIVPNTRAVGEHVEYEPDAWLYAIALSKHINRLCRAIAEAFTTRRDDPNPNTLLAIRYSARAAIVHSIGAERERFSSSEIKEDVRFQTTLQYEFEDNAPAAVFKGHHIVDFAVEKGEMSFHHALHYTFSWLVAKARWLSATELREQLTFTTEDLRASPCFRAKVPEYTSEEHLMVLFDIPLRVYVWLAQIKAKMWVRNGVTLNHQSQNYRSVANRDVGLQRDIFLLQVALVVCDQPDFLATIIARFGLSSWLQDPAGDLDPTIDEVQMADVAEEFIHLLTVLLCDRLALLVDVDDAEIRRLGVQREIAQILYFKPLSHSALSSGMTERVREDDDMESILHTMTNFRAPEGMNDTGMFELKPEYLELVDPYIAPYTRNQRDEAEQIYCKHVASKQGKPIAEIVFEPRPQEIKSGLFVTLPAFTATPIFAQIIYSMLKYALEVNQLDVKTDRTSDTRGLPLTHIERILQSVLHLVLVAVLEDKGALDGSVTFCHNLTSIETSDPEFPTIVSLLDALRNRTEFASLHVKVRTIFRRLHERRPHSLAQAAARSGVLLDRLDTESPLPAIRDAEQKKLDGKARAARALAQMRESQKAFAQTLALAEDDEVMSDGEEPAEVHNKNSFRFWSFPDGPCNYCQEECDEDRLYGTLSFITESAILRRTPQADSDWLEEIFTVPQDLDQQFHRHRPFGVASKNILQKSLPDGRQIAQQVLGKGFPRKEAWVGPVGTGCGHLMHYTCFENFIAATDARHRHQTARHQPENLKLRQFCCPYCKALGNCFLPILWRPKPTWIGLPSDDVSATDQWLHEFERTTKLDESHWSPNGPSTGATDYMRESLFPKLTPLVDFPINSAPPSGLQELQGMPGFFPPATHASLEMPQPHLQARAQELRKVYTNLDNTLKLEKLFTGGALTGWSDPAEDPTDVLTMTLGYSIAAAEIAQRGTASDFTFIDSISEQTLSYLRVLSETITAHIATQGLTAHWPGWDSAARWDAAHRMQRQLYPLLLPPFSVHDYNSHWSQTASVVEEDPFSLLAKISVAIIPFGAIQAMFRYMRLTYMLETVRVIISYAWSPVQGTVAIGAFDGVNISEATLAERWPCNDDQEQEFRSFVARICTFCREAVEVDMHYESEVKEVLSSPDGKAFCLHLRAAIAAYVLPFLRKTLLLLHVRFNVDFGNSFEMQQNGSANELSKLLLLLRLPSLNGLVAQRGIWEPMLQRWIAHGILRERSCTQQTQSALSRWTLPLAHPGIFELIGLPYKFATLADAAVALRCPTSGSELKDPCVCLWCGEIFCGQADCCSRDEGQLQVLGGAQRHKAHCGRNVGAYIAIRKNVLLLLHANHGSYFQAPYLDRYGEPDGSLRRNLELFLSQKRLDDFVRRAWLGHGIPSEIARRLESEHSTGGWDTL